jgi:hypothetical protein
MQDKDIQKSVQNIEKDLGFGLKPKILLYKNVLQN